jgi:hypothetical protein
LLPDLGGLMIAKSHMGLEQIFQRAAFDEFHPEAHTPFGEFRPVDPDHVRVIDLGEQARFVERLRQKVRRRRVGMEQLERDLPTQRWIPSSIDIAENALTDVLENSQISPTLWPRCLGGVTLLNLRNLIDDLKRANQLRFLMVCNELFGLSPVNRRP